MICQKCGASFDMEEAKFCPSCGKRIESKRKTSTITNFEYIKAVGKDAALTVMREVQGKTPEMAADYLFAARKAIPVYYVSLRYVEHYGGRSFRRSARFMAIPGYEYKGETRISNESKLTNYRAVIGETTINKSMNPSDFGISVFWTKDAAINSAKEYGWPISNS